MTQSQVIVMNMAGHHITIPLPSWTDLSSRTPAVDQSQAISNQPGPNAESVLFFPASETPVLWTHLVGVLAVNQPGYTADMQIASMIDPMRKSCSAGEMQVAKVPPIAKDGHGALLLVCGRYRPTSSSGRDCGGGMILAVVLADPRGAVKIYNEWCTSRFEVADTKTWPVPEIQMHAIALNLQTRSTFGPLGPVATPSP